jgi:hypothetical protein
MEQSIVLKIEFKEAFEKETLKFLRRIGAGREFKFISALLKSPAYKRDLLKYVKRDAPEDLAKAEAILSREHV